MDRALKALDFDKAKFEAASRNGLKALAALPRAETYDDLWAVMVNYAQSLGADLISYHHTAPEFAPNEKTMTVVSHGFPQSWVDTYLDNQYYKFDPIIQIFRYRVRPIRWLTIGQVVPLSPEQEAYMEALMSWMKGDGMGIPNFGPNGRTGYIGIGRSDRSIEDWDALVVNRLQWIAQSFHLRWCELVLLDLPTDFSLSAREKTILKSLALGTPDAIICGLVGAQLDSVRSSIHTIMRKMSVTDRSSAILRGMAAGIVDKDTAVTRGHWDD